MSMDSFREDAERRIAAAGVRATKLQVRAIVQGLFDGIVEEVRRDGRLIVKEFGTFVLQRRPRRITRNPRTGERHKRSADATIRFKCRAALK